MSKSGTSSMPAPNGRGALIGTTFIYGKELAGDVVQAIAYCTLYAQAATRAKLRGEGVDIMNCHIFRNRRYYDLFISFLTQLGLRVTSAGGGEVSGTQETETIKIADILQSVVGSYLDSIKKSLFLNIQELLRNGTSDDSINNFLTSWYNSSNYPNESQYVTSPIKLVDGNPEITMVFYTYNYKPSQWQSLFTEIQIDDFSLYSTSITLNLNMSHYYQVICPNIYPLLSGIIGDIKYTHLFFN